MKHQLCVCVALSLLTCAGAGAASIEAFDNATVQPGGPRAGSSGKAFFNIEGSDNGSFASYAVARFDAVALRAGLDVVFGAGMWAIDSIRLQLTQSNASFTSDGPVSVHFTGRDDISIESGVSPLAHPFSGDFADALQVHGFQFTEAVSGAVETHVLWARGTPNTAGAEALRADLLTDDVVTLALVDGSPAVAATFAGYTNFTYAGPTLEVIAAPVPEPQAYALMLAGVGLLGLVARRRRATHA